MTRRLDDTKDAAWLGVFLPRSGLVQAAASRFLPEATRESRGWLSPDAGGPPALPGAEWTAHATIRNHGWLSSDAGGPPALPVKKDARPDADAPKARDLEDSLFAPCFATVRLCLM